jgi:hypothetical protein
VGETLEKLSMDRTRPSSLVILFFILSIILAAATVVATRIIEHSRPDVRTQFTLYLEKLQPQSMLVAATTQERYSASKEFTAKLLAIFKIKAKIRLSALADLTYVIPAADPSAWSVRWDSKKRILSISTPPPDCLLPAVHTDTIEIVSENANLLTNTLFRLKEEAARMQSELSNDLMVHAKASLVEPQVLQSIEDGVRRFALVFCESAHIGKPAAIDIHVGSRLTEQ